jgi:4-hydroxybenzoate polyprenyltransferase
MLKTLIKSTRITWASKNVNMYLLALTYAYFYQIVIVNPFQILEGLILVSVLWGALYSLNDLTDIESDKKDQQKKDRAFIQEKVDKKWVMLFIGILIASVFLISALTLNLAFLLIMGLMVLNQVIYTVLPLRLKDTILAPFASTATNSVLRIASCCVILGNIFLVPLSVYFFMFTAGMVTYAMYKGKTNATIATGIIASLILVYAIYSGEMNIIQFAVAVLPATIAAIPLYLSLFTNKEKMMRLADILYHQVALVFFLLCIIYILF